MSELPSHAQVVIIGGGVGGCSIAYHLTKMGWKDVVLIELCEPHLSASEMPLRYKLSASVAVNARLKNAADWQTPAYRKDEVPRTYHVPALDIVSPAPAKV